MERYDIRVNVWGDVSGPQYEWETVKAEDGDFVLYADAQATVEALQRERDELQSVFDLGHTRTVETDKLWQEAHGQPKVWPDLGELVGWLMKRHDDVRAELEALRDERDRLRWALNFVVKTASDPELSFGDRVSVIRHTVQAALTPAGGGPHVHG